MGRPPRMDHAGAWTHIGTKGADGQDIFSDDTDRHRFIDLLGNAVGAHAVDLHAYCLMSNHVHLVLQSDEPCTAEALHHVLSRYARWYNYRHRRTGPVFTSRYYAKLLTGIDHAVAAFRYVHRNPLSFMSIESLPAYRWSSLPAYVGTVPRADWLTTDFFRSTFAHDTNRLLRFTTTPLSSDTTPAFGWEAPEVACDDIDAAVAVVVGVDPRGLDTPARGRTSEPHTLAVLLATELRVARTSELAIRYGFKSPSSVRTIARRGRVWVASQPEFAELHRQVLSALGMTA